MDREEFSLWHPVHLLRTPNHEDAGMAVATAARFEVGDLVVCVHLAKTDVPEQPYKSFAARLSASKDHPFSTSTTV